MNAKRIANQHHVTFESIRHFDESGQEFWLARQLADVLDYSQYRHFLPVIERAKEACLNSGQLVENHIEDVLTMVDIGSGAKREVPDVRLSRYACYLIVQNGDLRARFELFSQSQKKKSARAAFKRHRIIPLQIRLQQNERSLRSGYRLANP